MLSQLLMLQTQQQNTKYSDKDLGGGDLDTL
jgi:hypothetical protein